MIIKQTLNKGVLARGQTEKKKKNQKALNYVTVVDDPTLGTISKMAAPD